MADPNGSRFIENKGTRYYLLFYLFTTDKNLYRPLPLEIFSFLFTVFVIMELVKLCLRLFLPVGIKIVSL